MFDGCCTCAFLVTALVRVLCYRFVFFFKQKTAYEMRISDWSSDVCSSDLVSFCPDEFIVKFVEISSGKFSYSLLSIYPKTSCTSEARISFNYGGNNALCDWLCTGFDFLGALRRCYVSGERDRKRVVSGKSVSVSLDHGGARKIKKKKT